MSEILQLQKSCTCFCPCQSQLVVPELVDIQEARIFHPQRLTNKQGEIGGKTMEDLGDALDKASEALYFYRPTVGRWLAALEANKKLAS